MVTFEPVLLPDISINWNFPVTLAENRNVELASVTEKAVLIIALQKTENISLHKFF